MEQSISWLFHNHPSFEVSHNQSDHVRNLIVKVDGREHFIEETNKTIDHTPVFNYVINIDDRHTFIPLVGEHVLMAFVISLVIKSTY